MPLQKQIYRINMGKGLQTKVDPKVLGDGSFTSLQNTRFTTDNQLSKRYGFASVGVSTTSDILFNLQNYQGKLYGIGYNQTVTNIKSIYTPSSSGSYTIYSPTFNDCQINTQNVIIGSKATYQADSATANGVTLHAWSEVAPGSVIQCYVYYKVVNNTTGAIIVAPKVISSTQFSSPIDIRVIACGNNILVCWTYSSSYIITSYNTLTNIMSSTSNFATEYSSGPCPWDWISINSAITANQKIVMSAINSAKTISFYVLSNTGTVSLSSSYVASNTVSTLGMATPYSSSSATFTTVFADTLGGLYSIQNNINLSASAAVPLGTSYTNTFLITGIQKSDKSTLFFVNTQSISVPFYLNQINAFSINSSNTWTTSPVGTILGQNIHSKPIYNNDNSIYFSTVYPSFAQNQHFINQWIGSGAGLAQQNQIYPAARFLFGNTACNFTYSGGLATRTSYNICALTSSYTFDCMTIGQQFITSLTAVTIYPAVTQVNVSLTNNSYCSAVLNNQQVIVGGFNRSL